MARQGAIRLGIAGAAALAATHALAGSFVPPAEFEQFAEADSIVLAIRTEFPATGGAVRIVVYTDANSFLADASLKEWATVDERGVAVVRLRDLDPGPYAFVAYYDANGDGQLTRGGVLGTPKEPYAFSNGVKPKLRKPRFEEAAVNVAPGDVIVLTLQN